jgi:hypothetical protein
MNRNRIGYTVVGAILVLVAHAKCEPAVPGVVLPADVRTAIAENQKTFDATKVFHAVLRTEAHHRLEAGSRTLLTVEEIWYDRYHLREDLRESRFIGQDTTPLLTMTDARGNPGYFKPMLAGSVEMQSTESRMSFYEDVAYIRPPRVNEKDMRAETPILAYQMFLSHTIQEKVLESAKLGYSFTGQPDTVGADECLLLRCEYDEGSVLKFWLVPSKGYCVKKMQSIWKGKVYSEYETTLREYGPGQWWFDSVRARKWKEQEEEPHEDFRLTVESLNVNESIEPKVFTIAGTGIPLGTRIVDKITGLNYVYGQAQVYGENVDMALDALRDAEQTPAVEPSEETPGATDGNVLVQAPQGGQAAPLSVPMGQAKTGGRPLVLLGAGTVACVLLVLLVVHIRRAAKP